LVSETFAATITIVVVVVARIPSRSRRILHLVPSRIQLEKDPVVLIHRPISISCGDCIRNFRVGR